MCAPIISAGLGVMSSIGGMASQQQQANAQYAANKAQRQQIINNQRSKLTLDTANFHRRQADRRAADIEAGRAANRAYLGNQNVYNDKVRSFMVNKQNRLIKSMETAGVMQARGQQGGSIMAATQAVDAATGRDTAVGLANLRSAAANLISSNRDVSEKLQGEYFENYSKIGEEPTQGFNPPPVAKPAGPSPLSIAANIGESLMGAFSAQQAANTLPNGSTMAMMGGGNDYGGFTVPVQPFKNFNTGINFGF